MITFARVAAIAPDKGNEAMAFAHQTVKLIADKVGKKVSISMPIGGNPWRFLWVSTYENMAEFESTMTKLMADADYLKLLNSSGAYFIPGSTHDELWMGIE
jgi:hypothetical protein